jgi:hypothetical protein
MEYLEIMQRANMVERLETAWKSIDQVRGDDAGLNDYNQVEGDSCFMLLTSISEFSEHATLTGCFTHRAAAERNGLIVCTPYNTNRKYLYSKPQKVSAVPGCLRSFFPDKELPWIR